MIVTKTLRLYDDGGAEVANVDVEWLVMGEDMELLRVIGATELAGKVHRHAWTCPPDNDDITDAMTARMEAAQ